MQQHGLLTLTSLNVELIVETIPPSARRDESFGCRAIVVTRDESKLHGWLHWLRRQHTIYHEVARACEQLE